MTRQERISAEIEVWENAAVVYAKGLEEAKKYGDYGGMQHNEHMIQFSNDKIAALEDELQQLKSA
ncbi:hypothetical protein R50345_05910 [Paenibacillus sp. FSL R5-0345]|uniref:hypothetical protein n=1 Tax=Paenibacillus sp. FSL R5-0345 TaxID=1536770 RepID=UPI0004F8A3C9|nr:hypothetical protein [Paenibacillus sp. FSL R5-0345]AIQ34203.1 hypothetical protein R50345_05910 [Paenibacillus sp. FSL R5-0345]